MPAPRAPDPRQLKVLLAVAEAGGTADRVADPEASEACLIWGWLLPHGAHGFRLSEDGLAAVKAHAPDQKPRPSGVEARTHPRTEVMRRGAMVHHASGRSFRCTIIDISLGGARVQLYAPDLPKEDLTLIDREMGTAHQLRVAWSFGPFMGVAFTSTESLP